MSSCSLSHLALVTASLLVAACSASPTSNPTTDQDPPIEDAGPASDGSPTGDGAPADAATPSPASMVLRGGRIFTAAAGDFVSAVAIIDGALVYVGDDTGAAAWIGDTTRVIDLGGRVVLPGLHDTHQHPLESHLDIIDCAMSADVFEAEDHAEDLALCAPSAVTGWVLGSGHSVLALAEARRAPKAIIDDIFPDTPVAILEQTSHSTWVNSAALDALGIDDRTPDPQGGIIVRDEEGEATGILVDATGELPWNAALQPNAALDALNREAVRVSQDHNSRHGITSAVDARTYVGRGHLNAWRAAARADELTVRMVLSLWAYPGADDDAQLAELAGLYADDESLVRITQVKLYVDGLLENTTAALLEPYATETWGAERGLEYFDPPRLTRYVTDLQAAGFDLHIHAIGDRAVRQGLDAIEASRDGIGGERARHRLTHVELIHPDDVPRFAELGVYADMQLGEHTEPDHIHDLDTFIGPERIDARGWPLRTLHDTGATVVLSSDFDVGDVNPFPTLQRALTRGDQSLASVADAVRTMTIDAAHLMRSEAWTGSVEVGKAADLIVLDRDIFSVPVEQIGQTRVLWTLLEGDEVYRAAGFTP